MVDGIEGNQFHLPDIGLAILGQVLLITEDVHNFSYEVLASPTLVYLLSYTTLQLHRELLENRGDLKLIILLVLSVTSFVCLGYRICRHGHCQAYYCCYYYLSFFCSGFQINNPSEEAKEPNSSNISPDGLYTVI